MKKEKMILVLIVLLIICYYIYLYLTHSRSIKKYKITEEGFENINQLVDDRYKLKKLINTQTNNQFSIKLWDNFSKINSLYPKIPRTYQQCENKENLEGCPIAIWRTNPDPGYHSIGDSLVRTFNNPDTEKITDVRVSKNPSQLTLKNFDTYNVSGADLKPPSDFLYVGGFGNGKIIDRLEKNEEYYRLTKQAKFYWDKLVKDLDQVYIDLETQIKTYKKNVLRDLGSQINQLFKYQSINIQVGDSKQKLIEDLGNKTFSERSSLEKLIKSPPNPGQSFVYSLEESNGFVKNPYDPSSLLSGLPQSVIQKLNGSTTNDKLTGINVKYYLHKLTQLNIVTQPNDFKSGNLQRIFGNQSQYVINDQYHNLNDVNDLHSRFVSFPGVEFTIKHQSRGKGVSNYFIFSDTFGKLKSSDDFIFAYHDANNERKQTKTFYEINIGLHSQLFNDLSNQIKNNPSLNKSYTILKNSIESIKKIDPMLNREDYRRLDIWQPIPPKDYVALGFVFTDQKIKPNTSSIMCIPKNCVKSFKRRPWLKEDLVFNYKDTDQDLAFYRNPYLGTIIVLDQKKENGFFNNSFPDKMKYTNDPESLKWECFDIVPCIKECDYIDRLEKADKGARKMCKTYSSLENKYFEKQEFHKTTLEEEKRLRNLVNQRNNQIQNLMIKLNKMMTDDQLYQLINQGLNRYKTKKELENRHRIQNAVADHLMKTRGLEINWNNPADMNKFKDVIQKFVITRPTTQKPKRDCPVCKIPDDSDLVHLDDLQMCYGCLEDVVRELIGKKKSEGGELPQELKDLENRLENK